ncbi:MAG: ferritin-like domain-containing protein [Bacteroidota bacterium]|jgi:bacterioferritin
MEKQKVIQKLNDLLNYELAGAVRYLHYSFMVFGLRRIPVVEHLRKEAMESFGHATKLGEKITALGGSPSVSLSESLKGKKKTVEQILEESLKHETNAVKMYSELLKLVEDDIVLDAFVRDFVGEEQSHVEEVEKMLRES